PTRLMLLYTPSFPSTSSRLLGHSEQPAAAGSKTEAATTPSTRTAPAYAKAIPSRSGQERRRPSGYAMTAWATRDTAATYSTSQTDKAKDEPTLGLFHSSRNQAIAAALRITPSLRWEGRAQAIRPTTRSA